jgi:hypothetical protein
VADYCSSPDTLTLTVGSTTIDLMSDQQGLRVSALDLGYPAVREVVIDNADRNGATDLTRLLGPRPVVITGALVPSPAGSRQKAWHLLAPFLDPSARVTMTYRVDADAIVKTITLRAAQATATFDNPSTSPAQVGFKAADPVAYDQNLQTVYVSAQTALGAGRAYNLVFNRVYPAGGAQTQDTVNNGDLNTFPLLRLYGPGSNPLQVQWSVFLPTSITYTFAFLNSYLLSAGNYIQIDCKARTVTLNGDPGQNLYSQVDFSHSSGGWPYIPAGSRTRWFLNAGSSSTTTQLQVNWQDAYLL